MKGKIGWAVLVILSFLPVIPWYFLGTFHNLQPNYSNVTHAIGQLAALIGMTMFALTFILSTRMKFLEDFFCGLDKVYVAHSILGGTALVLLLFHPIFLVLKFIPSNIKLAADYLSFSRYWSVNFGIIALSGLIILLAVTFYFNIRYHHWKLSHKFLGLFFVFAVLHIFMVRNTVARDYIFSGYYAYAAIVSFIGLSAFAYSLFLRGRFSMAMYRIETIEKANGRFDLLLSPVHKVIKHKSGQFVFLRFYGKKISSEAHPFSIASKVNDKLMRVVIKNLGDFTEKLALLQKGDRVSVEGPYGRFNYSKNNKEKVWLAAGIGVTPFIGMVQELTHLSPQVDFFYSVRDKRDLVGMDMFDKIQKETNGRFRVFPWITSEEGRISVKDIAKACGKIKHKEFYLCGPKGFKDSLIAQIRQAGVPENMIHYEEFSFK